MSERNESPSSAPGPGDDELLTVAGARALAQADVVVVDQLPRTTLLAGHCRPDVEVLDAGFGADGAPLTRAGRAKLVVQAARRGAHVVRLMDGDVGPFSGLAEEIAACRKADIAFDRRAGCLGDPGGPRLRRGRADPGRCRRAAPGQPAGRRGRLVASTPASRRPSSCSSRRAELAAAAAGLVAAGRRREHAGRGHRRRHHDPSTHRVLPPGRGRCPAARQRPDRGSPSSTLTVVVGRGRDRPTSRPRGSRPSRCSAGGCWCPAPRTRPARSCARLAEHGAVAEVVPTIAVEPPRTAAQMDKAVKGLVTGRYEWVGFTSVNAVRAIREKVRGVRSGRPGLRRPEDRRRRRRHRRRAARVGHRARPGAARRVESARPGCSRSGRPTTSRSTRSTGCCCPAPTSPPTPWSPACRPAGWEVDDVTAYRTVRAAPPPAPIREAIKARSVRRRRLHLELDGSQPGRHRGQAAPRHRDRLHRPADGQDGAGARSAGRRAGSRTERRGPGAGPGRVRAVPAPQCR